MFGIKKIKVPVEVSARHIHLAKPELEILFGQGYELKKLKELSQPSDFACEETVDIQVGLKKIDRVRVVGPLRNQTQIELSLSDTIGSRVTPPIRLSGDLKDSVGAILYGPNGNVELKEGLIIARRHLHCSSDDAKKLKLRSGQFVSVEILSERATTFHLIEVRVNDNYKLCVHLDTDEGNAAQINKIGEGTLSTIDFSKK